MIETTSFWTSFLSQLSATFVVMIAGSFIAPLIINWRQRSQLEFCKSDGKWRYSRFNFTPNEDGKSFEITMDLIVRNLGKKTSERCYWSIYLDKNIAPEFQKRPSHSTNDTLLKKERGDFNVYYGYINAPIFSMDQIDFPFEIKIKTSEQKKVKLYYYFSNDYGLSPFRANILLFIGKIKGLKSLTVE